MTDISLNLFDDLLLYTTLDGEILDANDLFTDVFKKSKDALIGKKECEVLDIECSSKNSYDLVKENGHVILDEIIILQDENHYFKTKKEIIFDKKANCEIIKINRKDMSFSKYDFIQNNEHKNLLKYIAKGESIEFILNEIIKSVESRNPDMICSILLLDESGEKLLKAAAPSLPEYYTDKLEGMLIGEKVGSCGAAVYLKKRVIVSDISTHENWKYAKNLAHKVNLRACWSQPFFSSSNKVLGSFAIYYNETKEPTDFDIYLIEDIASIVGIAVDIAQSKKKDDLLFQQSKMAEMGKMIENIAHQWKQPLSVILSAATGIRFNTSIQSTNNEGIIRPLDSIEDSVQYLSKTIDDFRDFFKIKKQKELFFLNKTFDKTLNILSSEFKNRNIDILLDIEKIEVLGFENELIQVFMNILNNAKDALIKNKISNKVILINVTKDNDKLKINITDNAGGVPSDIKSRIFESYFTTKEDTGGTGIGLYMSKMIIEKHMKGTIEVENVDFEHKNSIYHGAKFTITSSF